MVRLGTPDQVSEFFMTDDSEIIFRLHQAGFQPMWKDDSVVFFKKSNKLIKLLKKLDIDIEE
jgi:hypothetical protein|uniref:Uncharacterized protein n=1 Tax=Siphoviridae sp. ct0Wl9 TaxID=2827763 RepID=A0A8S5T967_9CAUD|nr:MAG TPA: hypothetical protein [Siphoviridae sp. ct0Wl9]DAI11339.1 MAG TPA: hypothetical protein [Caudoviricetes sp.]